MKGERKGEQGKEEIWLKAEWNLKGGWGMRRKWTRKKRKKFKREKGSKKVKWGRKSIEINRQEVIQKAGSRRVWVAVSNESFTSDDSWMTNSLQPFLLHICIDASETAHRNKTQRLPHLHNATAGGETAPASFWFLYFSISCLSSARIVVPEIHRFECEWNCWGSVKGCCGPLQGSDVKGFPAAFWSCGFMSGSQPL